MDLINPLDNDWIEFEDDSFDYDYDYDMGDDEDYEVEQILELFEKKYGKQRVAR